MMETLRTCGDNFPSLNSINGKSEKTFIVRPEEDKLSKQPTNKTGIQLRCSPEEFEVDPDMVCGIGWFKPCWMQAWATPKMYLLLYSILGVITGIYYTYRIGVITTLEKRFSFKSKTSGIIMMIDEISPVFLGAQIGYLGGKFHRPRVFGLGMLMTTLCCFVSALPFFIYGPASSLSKLRVHNETDFEVCLAGEDGMCEPDDRPPTMAAVLLLMLAGFFKGFGNVAFNSIGLSYLDDNAKKKNTALYFAATFSVRLVGPVLGYLLASLFLKYPENPLSEPNVNMHDPRWIGAWWMGFVFQGVLLIFFTIPLIMFPKVLPGQKKQLRVTETSFKDWLSSTKRLLFNPIYMAIGITCCLQIFGSAGHILMLPKYMEQQFRFSASDANLYSGPPGILAIVASTVIGGLYVWKVKPGARHQIGILILMALFSVVGYLLLMIPKCDPLQMQNFGQDSYGLILEGACNSNCNCSTRTFTPVCDAHSKTTFFSPCFAGCTDRQYDNRTFSECPCLFDDAAGMNSSHVTEGYCVSEDCWSHALPYIVWFPVMQFFVNLLKVQLTILMLRSVRKEDKSIALGFLDTQTCILGFVPFLLIFGPLVDTTCLVWEKSCGESGNCWFYDTDHLNFLVHSISAAFNLLSVFSLLIPFFLSRRLGNLYSEEEELTTDLSRSEGNSTELNSVTKTVTKF